MNVGTAQVVKAALNAAVTCLVQREQQEKKKGTHTQSERVYALTISSNVVFSFHVEVKTQCNDHASIWECVCMCIFSCLLALLLLCGKYFFGRIIPVCSQNNHPAFSQNYLLLIPRVWASHLLPFASLLTVSSWSAKVCMREGEIEAEGKRTKAERINMWQVKLCPRTRRVRWCQGQIKTITGVHARESSPPHTSSPPHDLFLKNTLYACAAV